MRVLGGMLESGSRGKANCLAAADRMDDFNAIVLCQQARSVLAARNNLLIDLDSDTLVFVAVRMKKIEHAALIVDFAGLAIERYFHSLHSSGRAHSATPPPAVQKTTPR